MPVLWFKKKILFSDLLAKFAEIHLPTVSAGSRLRYEVDIKYRIEPYFGFLKLADITQIQVDSFRAHIMKSISPKSVNNCTVLLALLFNKAVKWGILKKSPMVCMKKLRLPETRYSWWENREDISCFLAEAKKTPYYAAYLLALECGLRLGEIIGLSKKDVDLKRCQIHIHQQWLTVERKLGPPKGRKQRFINFDSRSDLRLALEEAIRKSPHEDAIFVSRTGRRVHPTKLRAKLFPKLIKKSKVPKIRFHDLRHTFASWYMLQNDNIRDLKEILGHVDIQTTQRYAHLSSRHLNRGISWSNTFPPKLPGVAPQIHA